MKFSLLSLVAVSFSLNAYAAHPCNASGADPLDCTTQDGKYEILISPNRNITALGISTTAFCDGGYIKINGKEINGAFDSEETDSGLSFVEAVTSELGVRVNDKALHKVMVPKTVIGFVLNDAGQAMVPGIDSGSVLVFSDNTALMYLMDGDKQADYKRLTCK